MGNVTAKSLACGLVIGLKLPLKHSWVHHKNCIKHFSFIRCVVFEMTPEKLARSIFFPYCLKGPIILYSDGRTLLSLSLFVTYLKSAQPFSSLHKFPSPDMIGPLMMMCNVWSSFWSCWHPHMKVFQTAVSFKSLASDTAQSGDSDVASPEVNNFLSSLESAESAEVELCVLGSTAVFCPWLEGTCRNKGTSSCSLVKRPRWSSTLLDWALVSMSRKPVIQRKSC